MACFRDCQMQVARFIPVSGLGIPYQYIMSYHGDNLPQYTGIRRESDDVLLHWKLLLRVPVCLHRKALYGR